ncbi:hypothetical protein LJK88_20555 [Paenibacillus sp. P26]|nr:hypothetical protein LJK88_20555 [Paenibacillus sp. P26]
MTAKMRPGDLVLIRGVTLIGDTIEFITHSPYSHLAGVVNPNNYLRLKDSAVPDTRASFFMRVGATCTPVTS